jgi:hypothetical protein
MIGYPPGQEWREPILNAWAEETTRGLGFEGERRINWILDDTPRGHADLARIMRGEACNWCLQTFPARVGLGELGVWRVNAVFFRGIQRERLLRLVAQGCCPTCAKPVGVAEKDHQGEIPGVTPVETAAASFFEEGEASRAAHARKGRWNRGKRRAGR